MDDLTGKSESNSKVGSLFEGLTLLSITLMLIGIYLYASGSIAAFWIVLFGMLVGIGIAGSIVASYYQIDKTEAMAETRKFRVSRQLLETLRAKNLPYDVLFGLKDMIKDGDVTVQRETAFVERLDAAFGKERSREISAVIMRYAQVVADERPPENGKPASAPDFNEATLQKNAATAVSAV